MLPEAIPALTSIADNARGVIDEVSDAVWMIDPKLDSLQELVVRVRALAADLFDGQSVGWTVESPGDASAVSLAPEQRRHVYLILKESLTNILRHARASSVGVQVARSDGDVRFDVSDDGIGLPAAGSQSRTNGGRGLAGMQARAEAIGGTLTVTSGRDGRGTRITLEMPRRPPA